MGRIKKSLGNSSVNLIEQLYNNSIDKELFIKLVRQAPVSVLTKDRMEFSIEILKTEIEQLAQLATEVFGSYSGGLKKSEVRSIAMHYLRNRHKCTYTELGKPFKLTHSAVLYGVNLVEGFISVDAEYTSKYSDFLLKAEELMATIHAKSKISKLKFTLIDDGNTDIAN